MVSLTGGAAEIYFEMYVDDVRLQGQVGYLIQQGITRENLRIQNYYFLNTHLHFDIAYNGADAESGKYKVGGSSKIIA